MSWSAVLSECILIMNLRVTHQFDEQMTPRWPVDHTLRHWFLVSNHEIEIETPLATHMERSCYHGPLSRYVKLRDAHAQGMPGTFTPPPLISDLDMHHGTCMTHVPGCIPGSLISGFLWNQWRGKRSRHSRRMRNPQFYVSGKRPMMMSSRGHTFHVIWLGPLCVETAVHPWISLIKTSNTELWWAFFYISLHKRLNKHSSGWLFKSH